MVLPNAIKRLYSRVGQVGLTRAFVTRTAFPHWWDDEIANNPAGYAQGLMLLSRHLGLDLAFCIYFSTVCGVKPKKLPQATM